MMVKWMQIHTEQKDETKENYDVYHDYCVVQVQLPLHRLDYGGKEETETADDGVLVYPT